MDEQNNLPPKGLANALFYSALTLVSVCMGLLVFFRESNFVEKNLAVIAILAVFLGVPVFGTLIMAFGEKVGLSKKSVDRKGSE